MVTGYHHRDCIIITVINIIISMSVYWIVIFYPSFLFPFMQIQFFEFSRSILRLLFGILFIYVSLYFWVDFVKSLLISYDFLDSTWVLLIFKYLIALSLLVYSTALYQPWGFYRLILGYSGAIFCLTFMCVLKYEGLTTTNL